MKEKIKQIIYENSYNGGMCENIEDGQIIGIKTNVELDLIADKIIELYEIHKITNNRRTRAEKY